MELSTDRLGFNRTPMKQSGRVSLIGLAGVAALLMIVAVLTMSKESMTSVGGRFMSALAHKDANTLTNMTYLGKRSPDEIRTEWDIALNRAGKYYNFAYQVVNGAEADKNNGAVTVMVSRNIDSGSSYEEKFQIPLVKVNDEWKVDVANISSEMYPGLPR